MNAKPTILTLIFLAVFAIAEAGEMTVKFYATGNCYLCKVRIEEACSEVPGYIDANWDYSNDVTTVTYDDAVADPHTFMTAIADVGHDTEWYRAPDEAYAELQGTCCEYNRILTYENVEIGYLSIMDLWIFGLDIELNKVAEKIVVYPNPVSEILFLKSELSNIDKIEIYDVTGRQVKSISKVENQINLSSLENGLHLLKFWEEEKLVSINKIQISK